MTEPLTAWIEKYRRAWESNDPEDIRDLFAADAEYRTEPYSEPWRGQGEIVQGWLNSADEPGEVEFDWTPIVSTPDLGILEATTVYARRGRAYNNLWVVRFDPDGRATEFTEWWMEQDGD